MTKEQEIELLKSNSPYSLPDNTAESGLSSAQIKKKFYSGLFLIHDLLCDYKDANDTKVDNHIANASNPHSVTKTQIGLSNVENKTMDNVPTANSDNYVKSGGVKAELDKLTNGTNIVDKATKDANGNVITSTYETKVDATSKLTTANNYSDTNLQKVTTGSVTANKALKDSDGLTINTGYIKKTDVVDNLTTQSSNAPLSANQGKTLDEKITLRALITETGNKITLEIDNTTYKFKAKLFDKNDNLLSTSNEIDLPLETMVVNATYDNVNKKIILTLKNGTTVDVPVGALVSGLASETYVNTQVGNEATTRATNDTTLQTNITAEQTRAEQVESGLDTRLDTIEADYLKASDKTALQSQITENANDIDTLESGLSTETSNRGSADSELQDSIDEINDSAVMTSGIDSTKVAQIQTNADNIATKQNKVYLSIVSGMLCITYEI